MSDLLAVLVLLAIPGSILLTVRVLNRRAERRDTWSARHHTGGTGVGHHPLPSAFAGGPPPPGRSV